tara:strand:+ start:484 stop:732 length:249 start_codon:yes stop_codon:yes gene_type:complete
MEVSNPQRFENFSIYINSSMKYLTIILIVLLTGCSKAPDILEKILEKARILQEEQKVLTDQEKALIQEADNKEWEKVDNDSK